MTVVASDYLDQAVASRAVVTLATRDGGTVVAGRFLSRSAAPEGIWVQPGRSDAGKLEALAGDKAGVVGAFLTDKARFVFGATLLKRDKHHWVTDSVCVDAVLLSVPDDLSRQEFRGNRRHRISDDSGGVYAKLFRTGADGKPEEIPGSLWDLSCGGASFVCPMGRSLGDLSARALVVQLFVRGKKILVAVRQAHAKQFSTKTVRLGLRFDFSRPASAVAQQAVLEACAELEARGK
jgi:hypothetical protein